jgi:hypothetical protein
VLLSRSYFSYEGVPRLSYFWANPNHAAAVLVALIAVFWVLRFRIELRGWRIGLYTFVAGLELFWALLIGWTFSRGALVAWLVALITFGLIKGKSLRVQRPRDMIVFWMLSVAFLLVALLATETGNRFVDIADGDRSALNRLGVWSDALKLIYGAPLTGWGAGQSGNALVHWFVPVDSTKEYVAIVGTYLHIGAEFGLLALTGVFAVLGMTLTVGFGARSNLTGWKEGMLTASMVGLVGFSTAGLFSTLWVNPSTSGVVPVCIVLVWIIAWRARAINVRTIATGLAAALTLGSAVYVAGSFLAHREAYTIRKIPEGVTITKESAANRTADAVFLVDGLALGTFYGKSIRRIAEGIDHWRTLYVYTGPPSWSEHADAELVIFGARITDVPKEIVAKATVVAPVAAYSFERYGVPLSVLLPEYDEFGHAASWLSGLNSRGTNIRVMADIGQDCSGQVPALIKAFQEKAK